MGMRVGQKKLLPFLASQVSEINKALPPGVTIVDFYDQAELVDNSVHTVVESLIEGEVLVLVILVLLRLTTSCQRRSFCCAASLSNTAHFVTRQANGASKKCWGT